MTSQTGRGRLARLHGGWRGDVLALLGGGGLPLAYAPFGWFPVAVLAPALLFFLWLQVTPGRAWRRGYLFGLGMFGTGVSWVFVSMYDYGGMGLGLSLFVTAFFIGFLAFFPASLGYLVVRGFSPLGFVPKLLLVFPAGWVLWEWVRGWFLTGFPWLHLGYSQSDSPLAGWVPVLGVYGASLMVALSAGSLLVLLRARTGARRLACALILAAIWGGGAALKEVAWTRPFGAPMKVSLLQGNIPQNVKWLAEALEPTIDLYTRMTRAHWDSRLIVWPETALPDFYGDELATFDRLEQEARAHRSSLLIGVLYQREDGRYYNSLLGLGGAERQFYHKRHLVPFTEYLPMTWLFGGVVSIMNVPMSHFSMGKSHQGPLEAAGQNIGVSICYEDAFGEEIIRALPQATLLVNVSDDAWFGDSLAPYQHLQMARLRALETGRPLLRDTNTGMTALIDAHGRLQAEAPPFETDALTGEVQPMTGMTPYARWGNGTVLVVLALMLGTARGLRGR